MIQLTEEAEIGLAKVLVRLHFKYCRKIAEDKAVCAQSKRIITQNSASVEPEKVTEISPQPVRNRRRRRHNKCAEESAI